MPASASFVVFLAGMLSTGKSHITLALGFIACAANPGVLHSTSAEMLARLTMTLADATLTQPLKPYTRAELPILDEVRLEQVERDGARRSGLTAGAAARYNEQRSTIVNDSRKVSLFADMIYICCKIAIYKYRRKRLA